MLKIYSDNRKISELNWVPTMTLDSALKSAWLWEKTNNNIDNGITTCFVHWCKL